MKRATRLRIARRALKANYAPDGLVLLHRPHRHQFHVYEQRCIICGVPRDVMEQNKKRWSRKKRSFASKHLQPFNLVVPQAATVSFEVVAQSVAQASVFDDWSAFHEDR